MKFVIFEPDPNRRGRVLQASSQCPDLFEIRPEEVSPEALRTARLDGLLMQSPFAERWGAGLRRDETQFLAASPEEIATHFPPWIVVLADPLDDGRTSNDWLDEMFGILARDLREQNQRAEGSLIRIGCFAYTTMTGFGESPEDIVASLVRCFCAFPASREQSR